MRHSLLFTAVLAVAAAAQAAPVPYAFVTGPTAFGGPAAPGGPAPDPAWFAGGVRGSFVYDAAAGAVATNADGSVNFRGYTPASQSGFATAMASLVGQVAGRSFSDVSGAATAGNDVGPAGGAKADLLSLLADPDLSSSSPRNLTGFEIGGFTLYRVRLFWQEGQQTPETVPDFLDAPLLPAVLPAFHGRLALDFYQTGNTAARSFVFLDGLTVTPVPEPAAPWLLAAGLAALALRRRLRAG